SGLFSHRRSPRNVLARNLIPASGDQDHTLLLVRSPHPSSDDAANVHRNPPDVRDDAYAPPIEAGCVQTIIFFCKTEEEYFSRKGLTQLLIRRTDAPDGPGQVFEESSNPWKSSLVRSRRNTSSRSA